MQFTSQRVFALHHKNIGRIESFKGRKTGREYETEHT